MSREQEEVVVVGAGPAGMLLAFRLATAGVPVHVVERHADFKREFRGEGIQVSVVRHLRELGLLDELFATGIAIRAASATIFLDERPVARLEGVGDDVDFGIILHQERFLAFLHERLSALPCYRATLGAAVRDVVREGGRVTALVVGVGSEERRIGGRCFVVAAGRGTPLRKAVGLAAVPLDTHFNILWMRLPAPDEEALVPDGFRAYLTGDNLFILHPTADRQVQLAWSRRDEGPLKDPDFERRKALLLDEAPRPYRQFLEETFTRDTRTQFLRVQADRLPSWSVPGVLFIGDAAHTMSPVAGQGINLAMRDAIVAANHMLAALAAGRELDDDVAAAIQEEREREVALMQTFQRRLGYVMLGAPPWQVRLFFGAALPLLTFLGVRQRMLKLVQAGVTPVHVRTPALPVAASSRRQIALSSDQEGAP